MYLSVQRLSPSKLGAFKEALKLIEQYPDIADDGIIEVLTSQPSNNDDLFIHISSKKSKPKSLKLCLGDELRSGERTIRTLMLHVGISRCEALKYKKTSW